MLSLLAVDSLIFVASMSEAMNNVTSKLSHASLHDAVFYTFAVSAMMGSLLVSYTQNIVHAAFALLLTLASVAGLYVFLSADFLVAVQIMVYVGGVLVLLLFGILLTGRPVAGREKEISVGHKTMALTIFAGVLILLTSIIRDTNWGVMMPGAYVETTRLIAVELMSSYLLPFEIISALLIAALVGAVSISRSSKET